MKKLPLLTLAMALTTTTLAINANAQATPATPATQAPSTPSPTQPAVPATQVESKLNGKWHFILNTDGGDRDFDADFSVDAQGNVTGTWEKAAVAGTYKDGHLQLAFDTFSEEANETAQLKIDGKLDETSTIAGTWSFSSYDGTFKAMRPKA